MASSACAGGGGCRVLFSFHQSVNLHPPMEPDSNVNFPCVGVLERTNGDRDEWMLFRRKGEQKRLLFLCSCAFLRMILLVFWSLVKCAPGFVSSSSASSVFRPAMRSRALMHATLKRNFFPSDSRRCAWCICILFLVVLL
ncbi:unnamed protein product [Ectocarpus fasciculatus]